MHEHIFVNKLMIVQIIFSCFVYKKRRDLAKVSCCAGRLWQIKTKKQKGGKFQNLSTFFTEPTHYSKSQIFVQKFNFDKTPTFSRVFHPKFFWQFFSWNQSCQQLKSPKPQHFHEFFTPKKIYNFLFRKIKVEFLD